MLPTKFFWTDKKSKRRNKWLFWKVKKTYPNQLQEKMSNSQVSDGWLRKKVYQRSYIYGFFGQILTQSLNFTLLFNDRFSDFY